MFSLLLRLGSRIFSRGVPTELSDEGRLPCCELILVVRDHGPGGGDIGGPIMADEKSGEEDEGDNTGDLLIPMARQFLF